MSKSILISICVIFLLIKPFILFTLFTPCQCDVFLCFCHFPIWCTWSGVLFAKGWGGTLIFSYIPRLGSFLGFKILQFQCFGVFRKNNTFGGMKILWIFLGGHHKIGLHFNRCHFYAFYGLFFRSRYRMGDIF